MLLYLLLIKMHYSVITLVQTDSAIFKTEVMYIVLVIFNNVSGGGGGLYFSIFLYSPNNDKCALKRTKCLSYNMECIFIVLFGAYRRGHLFIFNYSKCFRTLSQSK